MSDWDTLMRTHPQNTEPNEIFVRFVMRNWRNATDRSRVRFLDLGCGAGANSQYLAKSGFSVTALDSSLGALDLLKQRIERARDFAALGRVEFICHDICNWPEWEAREKYYDCIFDNNSLCHLRTPPFLWIQDALKPGGKFWSSCPAHDTWKGTLKHKGFYRTPTHDQLRALLNGFSKVEIGKASYPDGHHQITSWIAECVK